MNTTPTVSVIIPTYKRADKLQRAIKSIINQQYSHVEVLVVDDNMEQFYSSKVVSLVKEHAGVRLISYQGNKGACFARNEGAKKAIGEIIMFLDDDDYYLPGKINKQVEVLKNPNIDACLSSMKRIDEHENEIISPENFCRGENLHDYILLGNCFTSMLAIKKKIFLTLGGFSEIPRFQDKFFMYKFLAHNFTVTLLKEQLFVLTEHTENRISLSNHGKIANALNTLYNFEKEHFEIFDNNEQKKLKKRHYTNLAKSTTSAPIKQRVKGLFYLAKGKSISLKLYLRLILSDSYFNKIKTIFAS